MQQIAIQSDTPRLTVVPPRSMATDRTSLRACVTGVLITVYCAILVSALELRSKFAPQSCKSRHQSEDRRKEFVAKKPSEKTQLPRRAAARAGSAPATNAARSGAGARSGGAALAFYEHAMSLLAKLRATQSDTIQKAADLCAERIARGGLVFIFGAGHSRMMAEEMTPRQGCFAGFVALVESALSNHAAIIGPNGLRAALYLENYEGYAEQILRGFQFGPHDAFIIVSTSGIRPVIVEMAIGAQARQLPVIAIVSKAHCEEAKPAHSSGKKLIDCADLIIDNQCPPGDCVLELPGLEWRTGPVSTITGAMIINMLRCATAEGLLARGIKPELLPSHQFVGSSDAAEQLEAFYEAYRKSLNHLYDAAWKRHEQSGRPLPSVNARPQRPTGADPNKAAKPHE
jgi:uncharacterized phosphosugar-binding protein